MTHNLLEYEKEIEDELLRGSHGPAYLPVLLAKTVVSIIANLETLEKEIEKLKIRTILL